MSEFLERARRISAENAAAEQRRQDEAAQQRTQEEIDHQRSRARAEAFVSIMRSHNVPLIRLAQKDGYNRVPFWQRVKHNFAPTDMGAAAGSSLRRLQEAQGHKLKIIDRGWVAVENCELIGDFYPDYVPGVFVSYKAQTYSYAKQAVSGYTTYVTPHGNEHTNGPLPVPEEGLLASDDAAERVARVLVERYGITS